MRRFLPTRFTLPLYAAAGLAIGLFFLSDAGNSGRIPAFFVCLLLLLMLLILHIRLTLIERIIRDSGLLPENSHRLSVAERLRTILDETNANTRRQVSTALADTQAEIGALQSQINPHFLYNTLDSIRGQALIDHSPVIADMTEALSVLFRYSVSRSGDLVTLREEFRCVEKYLMIQQFRFSGKFVFQKQIDEHLLSCLIPRLTLQPIVENAIYHGLETRAEGGVITLSLVQCGTYLVVRVSDNGIGISESQLIAINEKLRVSSLTSVPPTAKKGSGIALSNVHRRIRLAFGESYGLVISSLPGSGTDVEVTLPILHASDKKEEAV